MKQKAKPFPLGGIPKLSGGKGVKKNLRKHSVSGLCRGRGA